MGPIWPCLVYDGTLQTRLGPCEYFIVIKRNKKLKKPYENQVQLIKLNSSPNPLRNSWIICPIKQNVFAARLTMEQNENACLFLYRKILFNFIFSCTYLINRVCNIFGETRPNRIRAFKLFRTKSRREKMQNESIRISWKMINSCSVYSIVTIWRGAWVCLEPSTFVRIYVLKIYFKKNLYQYPWYRMCMSYTVLQSNLT